MPGTSNTFLSGFSSSRWRFWLIMSRATNPGCRHLTHSRYCFAPITTHPLSLTQRGWSHLMLCGFPSIQCRGLISAQARVLGRSSPHSVWGTFPPNPSSLLLDSGNERQVWKCGAEPQHPEPAKSLGLYPLVYCRSFLALTFTFS